MSTGNFIRPHQVKGERTQARAGTGSTRRKESEKRQRPKESE